MSKTARYSKKSASGSLSAVWGHVQPLFEAAKTGDKIAAAALLRIAYYSTRFLEIVYSLQPELIKKAVLTQSSHTGGEFPALCSWRKDREANRERMLAELNPGSASLLKVDFKRQTATFNVVHDIVLGVLRFNEAAGEIPPLTQQTVEKWVDAAEREFLPAGQDATQNKWAISIGHPERELSKRRRKARARLRAKYGAAPSDEPLAATRQAAWAKKISSMKITDAEVRSCFRDAVRRTLVSNLKK